MFSLHGRRESPGAKAASPARSGRIVVAGSVATLLMVCAPAGPAGAASAGASDGSGSVSVGVAGGASGGGSDPGSTGARPGGGSGPVLGSGGRPVAVCSLFALPAAQSAALGVGGPTPGAWYAVRCSVPQIDETTSHFEWIPAAAVTAGVPPVVDLSRLARRAEASIVLPKPTIGFDPSPFSVVNIVTWLWIDPALWRERSATASILGVSATAVARPVSVTWQTGDGQTVTCAGPGAVYRIDVPADAQSTSCWHVYTESSAGQGPAGDNDAAFRLRATVNWAVTWSASGVTAGGTLPALTTTSSTSLRVEQIESIGAA